MVNFQRNYLPVNADCRRQPRIEFQLPVSIMGIEARATIMDFSLDGFYIRVECTSNFNEGQLLKLALRFPGERNLSMIKVRVARRDTDGVGCEFIDLDPATKDTHPVFTGLESSSLERPRKQNPLSLKCRP